MYKFSLVILLSIMYCSSLTSQNMETIFTNVDTIFQGGSIGCLVATSDEVIPIVSSTPCSNEEYHYSIAATYQNGRVIAIGHEGLLSDKNIGLKDNLPFVLNAIEWLSFGQKRITLKEGWINNWNTKVLKEALEAEGYTINPLSETITATALSDTDILILGNDWNSEKPYSNEVLSTIENFVANGGAVFITGLGWSFPKGLENYPMNAVAKLFGMGYTKDIIYDPTANGDPSLYNFYPENVAVNREPYCPSVYIGTNYKRGDNLTVLRLAVSVTGEFTRKSGGVEATALLLEKWLEEINEIYGREYCMRFELIPNNNDIIFSIPGTDPWKTLPRGSGGCTNAHLILDDQAAVIDRLIRAENYDISHVIAGDPFGGGCAGGLKSGVSGGLDLGVTRHEMGHQFSQSHTINNGGKNNYEPENGGWSIQGGNGYAGFAHAVTYHQLSKVLVEDIPNKGKNIPTGNSIPDVDAGPDYIIPISTPFTLQATATDANANDKLTYVWDNMSLGTAQKIPVKDDTQGALFMRGLPSENSSRTFPKMEDVVANKNVTKEEQLPTQPRIMDIRVTVNDNHKMKYEGQVVNASGINSDDIQLIVADAGPFVVTSQNESGISYSGNSTQVVTWDVNGTDEAPVNTTMVSIHLSVDGGYTYPYVLYSATPNIGYASVFIPELTTTTARIKVAAVDNIFFDINTQNFEIK